MTLIAGLWCKDGLLLCSDREENGEIEKSSVKKIFEYGDSNCFFAIATAGHSALCDVAVKRIGEAAKAAGGKFASSHEKIIEEVLRDIHKSYIWPKDIPPDKDRDIGLIIALYDNGAQEFHLYLTCDEILQPRNDYACEGCGELIGGYFLERLYEHDLTLHEAMELMAFVVREAKDSVGAVGRETEMLTVTSGGMVGSFYSRSMDRNIPHLSQCLERFWKQKPKP